MTAPTTTTPEKQRKKKKISKDKNPKHNSPEIVKILWEMKGCEYLTFLWQSASGLLKAIKVRH